MEMIIPTNENISTLCVWGGTWDMVGPQLIHVSILAWSIGPDSTLPITPLGKVQPSGAWLVRDGCGNFICSDGTMYRDQHAATEWLRARERQLTAVGS